ncbi:hypothetical protein GCWU000282_00583 [Catonella morbi ATCC 51271]|uniref:Uncharacterized protein n=1 Tax=Catonella morbi ATCC 51271 TaxID=592026 RepID=V2ZBE2_9FIRM|nr:hypothetical protein GCWU000282_00583 [Catonella morbi ATCC 51271]
MIVVRLLQKELLFLKEILRGVAPFLCSASTSFDPDDPISGLISDPINSEGGNL